MSVGETTIGIKERAITRDSLVQQINRLEQIRSFSGCDRRSEQKLFGASVEIESAEVVRRRTFHRSLLGWRELGLQLIGNSLCNLVLNCENIGELPIITLSPQVLI